MNGRKQSLASLCHALDTLNVQASWLAAWQAFSAEDVNCLKVWSLRMLTQQGQIPMMRRAQDHVLLRQRASVTA